MQSLDYESIKIVSGQKAVFSKWKLFKRLDKISFKFILFEIVVNSVINILILYNLIFLKLKCVLHKSMKKYKFNFLVKLKKTLRGFILLKSHLLIALSLQWVSSVSQFNWVISLKFLNEQQYSSWGNPNLI